MSCTIVTRCEELSSSIPVDVRELEIAVILPLLSDTLDVAVILPFLSDMLDVAVILPLLSDMQPEVRTPVLRCTNLLCFCHLVSLMKLDAPVLVFPHHFGWLLQQATMTGMLVNLTTVLIT